MVNSNPILFAPIDDTINTIEVFKASETAPSTPTGTTVPPSGWSLTPIEEDNSNVIQISYFYSGSWLQQDGGVYKSNTITHNEITKERISFFCPADNVRIAIVITAYSESNYDFVLVGKLDSTALTRNSNYTDRISGNGSSKTVWLSVPTRGEHFFEVAYAKDSSASANGDYGLVQITQAVRMTKKPIWVSTIRTINNAFQQPWSTPVRWTGIEGDSGKDGENAQYIFLRGTGYNRKSPRVLNVCSQENKSENTEQRGLEVALVDRFTMKVLDIEYFDTYGGNTEEGHTSDEDPQMAANARARFVTYLTNVTSDVIVCITSYDAVGWSHAMEAKLKEFGLTKLTGVTYHDSAEVSGERKPFAFLGIKGLKQGYAYVDQESDDANAPFAEVTAYIIAGSFMSMPESSRGKTGRFFYYAGVWANSSAASFAVSDAQAPYFSYTPSGGNVGYYVFNPEENGTYTMADMGTPDPNNDPNWEKMTDDFKYIMTEALFTDFALLGGFVVSGDYMFSQYGRVRRWFDDSITQGANPYTDEYNNVWNRVVVGSISRYIYELVIDRKNFLVESPSGDTAVAYTYFLGIDSTPTTIDTDYIEFFPNYCVNMAAGQSVMKEASIEGILDARALATGISVIGTEASRNTYYNESEKRCSATVIFRIPNSTSQYAATVSIPSESVFKGSTITFIAPTDNVGYRALFFPDLRTVFDTSINIGMNYQPSGSNKKYAKLTIKSDGEYWWIIDAKNCRDVTHNTAFDYFD